MLLGQLAFTVRSAAAARAASPARTIPAAPAARTVVLTPPCCACSPHVRRRWVPGGHVTSFLLHHRSFRRAIVDSLAKLAQPPPLATTAQ